MTFAGHTYLVAGGVERIEAVRAFLEAEGVHMHANPDVYVRTFAQYGVDEVRDIRMRAATRALSNHRVFIVIAQVITVEAQNALLKTLEEPVEGTLFFFITPSPEMLLPTLKSRAQMLVVEAKAMGEGILDVKAFLAAPIAARLDMLKPLLEKGDDDKRDMSAVVGFLASLELALAPRAQETGMRESLRAVYRARGYTSDKGALVKPLLEHVALLVPQIR